jgi:membrane complex biogenesis BtpA family protein
VGINCLRNDARAALGAAVAAELDFVRVNVHTGAMLTDQGILQGDAAGTLRYRASLRADVAIYADVMVKHAAPLAERAIEDVARETAERGLADAVIVTGPATGQPVDRERLRSVRGAVDVPVLIGSGLTPENAAALWPLADGAIVGTWWKRGGRIDRPVDASRVARLVKVVQTLK